MNASRGMFTASHFLYDDDILLFCWGTKSNIKAEVDLFQTYGLFSNQWIIRRSPVFISVVRFQRCGKIKMSNSWAWGLVQHLGVPLFKGKRKVCYLKSITDKILSRFGEWKGRFLFYASRVCLLNSVITSSFVNYFIIYQWLLGLIANMQKDMRSFLWSSSVNVLKRVHVDWTIWCMPVKVEG